MALRGYAAAMSRCARCGYSLEGLASTSGGRIVCPECAHDQAPAETGRRWGRTRACLVTSLAVQVPLWAGMLTLGLSIRATEDTLVPLSFGAPLVIGIVAGGFAGYRAACQRDPAARGRGVERVWWYFVSLLFNGLIWLATMAVTFVVLLSHGPGW